MSTRDKVGDKKGHYPECRHPTRFNAIRQSAKADPGALPSFKSAEPIHFHRWAGWTQPRVKQELSPKDNTLDRKGFVPHVDVPVTDGAWRNHRDMGLAKFDRTKHAARLAKREAIKSKWLVVKK